MHRVFHLGDVRLGNAGLFGKFALLRRASMRKRRKLRAKISRSGWLCGTRLLLATGNARFRGLGHGAASCGFNSGMTGVATIKVAHGVR